MAIRLSGDASSNNRTTDHSEEIAKALFRAKQEEGDAISAMCHQLSAELLQAHDDTGVSLDDWPTARRFVEHFTEESVLPNLV